MDPISTATLVLQAAAAVLYLMVARAVASRTVQGRYALANRAYVTWWATLGIISLAGMAIAHLLRPDLPGLITWALTSLMAIMLALGALLFYLLFIYTGRSGVWMPIAAFYVAYYIATVYLVMWADPTGVVVEDGATTIEYVHDLEGHWISQVYGAFLVIPAIVAAAMYGRLYWRVQDPIQKLRIGTVSSSIFLWFASSLGATVTGQTGDTWALVAGAIAVLAAGANLMAYRPPKWLAARLAAASHSEGPATNYK